MAIDVAAVEDKIEETEFFFVGTLCVCVLKADNGFYTVGHAAPVDESEYDEETGKKFAYKMALDKLVAHEAYYKKEADFIEEKVDEMFSIASPDEGPDEYVQEMIDAVDDELADGG